MTNIPIANEPDLVRDPVSKSIMNTNIFALQEHRRKKRQYAQQQNRINTLEMQINELSNRLKELESYVRNITNG